VKGELQGDLNSAQGGNFPVEYRLKGAE
jgi:hypothetical protein